MEKHVSPWGRHASIKTSGPRTRPDGSMWKDHKCRRSGIGMVASGLLIALALYVEWEPEHLNALHRREDMLARGEPTSFIDSSSASSQMQDGDESEPSPDQPSPKPTIPDQTSPEEPTEPEAQIQLLPEPSSLSSSPAPPPDPIDPPLESPPPQMSPPPESPPPQMSPPPARPPPEMSPPPDSPPPSTPPPVEPPPLVSPVSTDNGERGGLGSGAEGNNEGQEGGVGEVADVEGEGATAGEGNIEGQEGGGGDVADMEGEGATAGEGERVTAGSEVAGGAPPEQNIPRWKSRDSPEYREAQRIRKERRREMKKRREAQQAREEAKLWEDIINPKEGWRRTILDELREAKQIITGEIPTVEPRLEPDDPQGSEYHDAAQFRRSYREMERRMKVYVYRHGRPPLVHGGPNLGIYASEGKIIRSLKTAANSPFVTTDPQKAHLFFLPFSVAECVRTFVNKSDGPERFVRYHKRMGDWFSEYIAHVASREPYFNLSRATDHFYVSCHDWGAKTARFVPMLQHNAMKLVCNADVRTGDFVPGRDAGYLEVYIKKRYPDKCGGARLRDRKILAFFAGQKVGKVRPALIDYWGPRADPDVQVFTRMSQEQKDEMPYEGRMRRARFCLCPAGHEVNSPRIVEAMMFECIPVIIADGFDLPFRDVLNWDMFSIRIQEADIPRIKEILLQVTDQQWDKLHRRLRHVRRHFIFNSPPEKYDAYHMGLHSIWLRRLISVNGVTPWNRTLQL